MHPLSIAVGDGQRDGEGGALARDALGRDVAAVAPDDLACDREPDPGAVVARATGKPLERDEDPFGVLLVEADAVVRDPEDEAVAGDRLPLGAGLAAGDDLAADPDLRRLALAVELERVAQQVLDELTHLRL